MKTIVLKTKQAVQHVKNISLLIIAISVTFSLNAQTWGTQSSLITDDINGLTFSKSVNTGFAVASGGRIIKTTNSGNTWVLQNSGTVNDLSAVSFSNNIIDTGYIVGDSGLVLMTINGGSSWSMIPSGTTAQLNDISIKNGEGFIVGDGGVILRVSGTSITPLTSNTTNNLYSVFMMNSTSAVVAGGGVLTATLLITYNSGTVWTPVSTGASSQLNDVFFINDSTAYVVGNIGTILKTTNYGANWTTQTGGGFNNLNAAYFVSKDSGYIAGAAGTLLRTINGGTTWTTAVSGTTNELKDIAFTDQYRGYAAGVAGTVIRTCPTVMFDASPNDSICIHSSANFTNQSKNATSYIWLQDGDTVSLNTDYSYQFDTVGNYSIRLIADNGTCQSSLTQVVNVGAAPVVNLGNDTTICSTCTITLNAGNVGSTYKWFRDGVATGVVSRTNTVGVAGTYRVDVENANGCVTSDSVKVSLSTGVETLSGNLVDLVIYPNPNNKVFAIDFSVKQKQETVITITNIIGDVVYSEYIAQAGKYANKISLEAFSSGVYFVNIKSGDSSQTMKVVTF
ncbi:MAG: YCF48-related protein [Bacteroidota bacterium]